MSKVILMMMLTVVSSSAVAEWIKVDDVSLVTSYFNPDTIHKVGSKAKLWILYDYKEPLTSEAGSYMSMKAQSEYECKKKQLRVIAVSVHSENMAGGKAIFTDSNPQEWKPFSTATRIDKMLWETACNAVTKWVEVGRNSTVTSYANPATIRKTGNWVKMWHISEWHTGTQVTNNGKSFISAKIQQEYDCKEQQSRQLAYSLHSDYMGGGESVYSESNSDKWKPVSPESTEEVLWKFACKKR